MGRGNGEGQGQGQVKVKAMVCEMKHKLITALNKLSDRDTYQLAADQLHNMAQSLTCDSFSPFLYCVLDTNRNDNNNKPSLNLNLRKESIRLIATLVTFHPSLIPPHLSRILSAIVNRLKDSDSVVRDACLDTLGLIASNLHLHLHADSAVIFVSLVRPLFEALGQQNKHLQFGSALSLATVIDLTPNPPLPLLYRMLIRTIKMLNNPHFLAKPAIIHLNRSIIQAGGASTQSIMCGAMTSIQQSLKDKDWLTRKAASVALSQLASTSTSTMGIGSLLSCFRSSCIQSLESCRFDKVKPVRDTVLHAIQCWRDLPGTDTPQPSEAGSSIKENFCGADYSDITSASESGRKDVAFKKVGMSSTKGRVPLSVRKKCQNSVENTQQQSKEDDWHIEIAVPKTHTLSFEELNNEESEGSSVTKTFERLSTDVASIRDIGYEYVHMDDKQECSSISTHATNAFETKLVKVTHHDPEKRSVPKLMERDQQFASEETCSEEQIYSTKIRDRRSLDSTMTESGSPSSHGCCLQIANEMVCIRKQLAQIEDKQTNLMDLLQVFNTGIMDSLAMLQSRVVCIEDAVDRLGQDAAVYRATSKLSKQSQILHSARHSTSTPRPSVDLNNRQPSLLSLKANETWAENVLERSPSNTSCHSKVKMSGNPIAMDIMKNVRQASQRKAYGQARKDSIFGTASSVVTRKSGFESKHTVWKRVKGFMCDGDLDSAYAEALNFGDELILMELFDSTGPVLECLSSRTVSDLLSTLASYLLQQKYITSVIPWMQQVVDLSNINGPNYLVLTAIARQKLLSAIQDAANMNFSNPLEKKCMGQIAVKLHHIWGNGS